jgi:acetyl esterase/lipase
MTAALRLTLAVAWLAGVQTPPTIALWPEGVPGARSDAGVEREIDGRIYNVQQPSLVHYPPSGRSSGTAVIVCPGGSYARLAIANEGAGAVARLTPLGVSVFVLKYRLAEFGQPAPLQDVLRAIRVVRSRAAEFGIRPDRIGLFGASAGGHVAASAATMFDAVEGRTGAEIDGVSARPDFVALLYPVITMRDPHLHAESRRNLLGASPSAVLIDTWSIELRARPDAPPLFLVHTSEDRSVPLANSTMLADALKRSGVSVELHLFERGAHGFGFSPGLGPTSEWPERWIAWMRAHGWL